MSAIASKKPSYFACNAYAVLLGCLMLVIAAITEFNAFANFANPEVSFLDAFGIALRTQVGVALMLGLAWAVVYAAQWLPKEDC